MNISIQSAIRPREEKSTPDQPPTSYMVFERRQHCVCCGRDHSWSELYAYSPIQAKWGFGKMVTNLKALMWPKYRLPIRQIGATATQRIPFCHECYGPSLEHAYELLDPPEGLVGRLSGLTAKPTIVPIAPKTEPKTKTKVAASVDDLEDLLR